MKNDYSNYLSVFTFRYASSKMKKIWSEHNKRLLWRKIWVAIAEVQSEAGLISQEELSDIKKHETNIDIPKALEIEKEIKHDVMAEVKAYAQQAKKGGGKIHLGATSMDVVDNADTLRIKESLYIVRRRVEELMGKWSQKIAEYKDLECMGYTHLQPAEPTTLGYRFAMYAFDLFNDSTALSHLETQIAGKGIKGAVGTSASYYNLLQGTKITPRQFEKKIMDKLGLQAVPIATQTYPRKLDFLVLSTLASIAQSAYKFAFDLRVLQSPLFGELSEGFAKKQVGSSAMPFKKNPITSEKICSLARYISSLPTVFWENAANSLLERTLDDSANRRVVYPNAFLALDEILISYSKILDTLIVSKPRIKHNLEEYGIFSSSEPVLMEAVKKGADRQLVHEKLRDLAMQAWDLVSTGQPNPFKDLLLKDKYLHKFLTGKELTKLISQKHTGNAYEKCTDIIKLLKSAKYVK